MINYSDFKLTNKQIEQIKKDNATKSILAYIKKNGVAPDNVDSFYTATPEELESYRRIYYSIFLAEGKELSQSDDDEAIISSGSTNESGDTKGNDSASDSGSSSESVYSEIPDNEIWYTTYDGSAITPTVTEENALCGSKLLKNIYKDGKGILTFESGITFIANRGFKGISNLKSVSIPSTIETIKGNCFQESGIEEITIPSSSKLTNIYGCAFYCCKNLKKINIPSVEKIGTYNDGGLGGNVFYRCSSLSEITLPSNCAEIEGYTFVGCSNLSSITIKAKEAPTIGSTTFYDIANNSTRVKSELVGSDVEKENRKLKIYEDATGYYDGLWASALIQTCGYTIEYI